MRHPACSHVRLTSNLSLKARHEVASFSICLAPNSSQTEETWRSSNLLSILPSTPRTPSPISSDVQCRPAAHGLSHRSHWRCPQAGILGHGVEAGQARSGPEVLVSIHGRPRRRQRNLLLIIHRPDGGRWFGAADHQNHGQGRPPGPPPRTTCRVGLGCKTSLELPPRRPSSKRTPPLGARPLSFSISQVAHRFDPAAGPLESPLWGRSGDDYVAGGTGQATGSVGLASVGPYGIGDAPTLSAWR